MCEGSNSKEFPPTDFEQNQPHSSLPLYFLIFFPNTNFWKMNMNMAGAYLLLYLCYGHLTVTTPSPHGFPIKLDFHGFPSWKANSNQGSYAFLCPSI